MIAEKDFPEGVPSAGGGTFEGPGGMAPAFAPGGPLDPLTPAMTEEYFQSVEQGAIQQGAFQPGFIGSGAPGDPMLGAGAPRDTPYPTSSIAAVGGAGAGSTVYPTPSNQGLPGHGTTPGRFQPGGGVHLPSTGQLPTQRPGTGRDPGFLARIVPVSGDVSRIIPVSGSGGEVAPPIQPSPPGVGGGPVIPPGRPGTRPPNPDLPGTVEPPIVIPPTEGGGPTYGKPKGLKTLPMPKDKVPPEGPPKPPGQWVTLDAGRGQPPAWAFIEDASTAGGDTGLTPEPKKTPGTLPTRPGPSGEKGHYVPVQLPYDVQPIDAQDEMVWAWVPNIDATYGVKEEEPPKPQPK